MPEYIDRDALRQAVLESQHDNPHPRGMAHIIHDCEHAHFVAMIARFPAADVAPVVHCKGCEHAERYERTDGTVGYYCGHPQNTFAYGERWDRVFKPVKEADDFCSYGEQKDGGASNG